MFLKGPVTAVVAMTMLACADDPCQTPNGQRGNCILINSCKSLYGYFENGPVTSPSIMNYLRRSNCGFVNGYPKVCCPIGSYLPPTVSNLLPPTCGITTVTKVIGGQKADLYDFPWMALLRFRAKNGRLFFACGGSLINKRYVLTAAHCVKSSLVSVRLGEYIIDSTTDCVQTTIGKDCADDVVDVDIEKKIVYENDDGNSHDIALLRLRREIEYTDFIKPICLPVSSDEIHKSYLGKNVTVAGWGATENGTSSNIKLYANLPVKELSACTAGFEKLGFNIDLHDGQICAGGERGIDSCSGDSGGPLMTFKLDENRDFRYYAIGVVSFGAKRCGQENVPAVYAKVAKYVKWIVANLEP